MDKEEGDSTAEKEEGYRTADNEEGDSNFEYDSEMKVDISLKQIKVE